MTVPVHTHIPDNTSPTMPKKSGCGCCLWGCFGLIVLAILFLVGGYFGLRYSTDLMFSDTTVSFVYKNYGRKKIEEVLPANMTPAEKQRVLAQTDATLQEYLDLPSEAKSQMRKEAMIALKYYSQGQIIPYDQIPVLKAFIDKQMKDFEGRPADSPRLLQ